MIFKHNTMEIGCCVQATTDKKHKLFIHTNIGCINGQKRVVICGFRSQKYLGIEKVKYIK